METTKDQPFLDLCYSRHLRLSCKSFTWCTMKKSHSYALISASHTDMTEDQKEKAQVQLANDAKKLYHYYCTELRGGVIETNTTGEISSLEGTSVFIRGISLNNAIKAGIQNRQDFILYCNGIDFLGLIDTSEKSGMSGNVLIEFAYRQPDQDQIVIQNAVKEYYERLIKWLNPEVLSVLDLKSRSFKLFEMYKRFEREGNDPWRIDGRKII